MGIFFFDRGLRLVPPFVTVHAFGASQVFSKLFKFLKKFAYYYKVILHGFLTMWKKHILARAIRTQKENWGQPHIFQR